ncbi:MAG TPA: serine/threonine-protein kinase [Dokdonella sp.]|uniref:serine/threonine-protein kinase n=1 Tax=Dokdonella sp. TaxID=2291710 RepID=UPI002D80EA64|nr:serine/threonine-protein kinase [Dokdonella sp.]HET9033380.1 serine/threonine-protein kinase [Dokdonella sp.]
MSRSSFTDLAKLLDEAFDLTPDARAALLARVARDHPQLHDELVAALAADACEQPLLDKVLVEAPAQIAAIPQTGDQIGPYQLLDRLGRGGMGEVWLAERVDGEFSQNVALKFIRPGFDNAFIRERFRRERQILAGLSHPNIAHLLDGGVSRSGQPWFALEYIRGEMLTSYASRLPLSARLPLFLIVCRAVQFAHARLIIHRDLKPGNILVCADGTPKLLDFGIATVFVTDEQSESPSTHPIGVAATPEYAAPEQLAGKSCTTATDVYALGLILFELISGQRARPASDPPPRPSAVVPNAGRRRGVQGDLDGIVQRALAIDPAHRYVSVEALANDIQNHLDGFPVRARPDSRMYRAHKFAIRHWMGLAATLLLLASLLAGIAGTIWQARLAWRQTANAEATKQFLVELFASSDPDQEPVQDLNAGELLEFGLARIESSLQEQPESKADLMHTLARVAKSLGRYDKARNLIEQAILIRRQYYAADAPELIESLGLRGAILIEQRDYAAAIEQLEKVCRLSAKRFGPASAAVAECQHRLGNAFDLDGQYAAASRALEAALTFQRAHPDGSSLELASTLSDLAALRHSQGQFAVAQGLAQEAVDRYRRVDSPAARSGLANGLVVLSYALRDQGQLARAESNIREAIAIDIARLPANHPLTLIARSELANVLTMQARFGLARDEYLSLLDAQRSRQGSTDAMSIAANLNNLGALERDQQNYVEAAARFRQAIELYVEMVGSAHPYVAMASASLARVLIRQGDFDEAAGLIKAALANYRAADMLASPVAGVAMLGQAELQLARRQADAARDWAQQTLDLWLPAFGADDWRVGRAELVLAQALIDLGQSEAAMRHLRGAVHALETQAFDREGCTAQARLLLSKLEGETANDTSASQSVRHPAQ